MTNISNIKSTSESEAVTLIYQKVKLGQDLEDLEINKFKKSLQPKGEKPKPILKYFKKSSNG